MKKAPFGLGLNRIHTLAGAKVVGEEFVLPEEFEDAERGF